MQVVTADVDPLTEELRKQIQDAAALLLAENRIKGLEGDPDHTGTPFVLTEEVQLKLHGLGYGLLPSVAVERALREDPYFVSRYRHGATLFFLKPQEKREAVGA